MWGAAALGSALSLPRRPRCDPAEPSFCLLWGGGWEGRESGQRAGRRDVAGDGLGGVRGGDPKRQNGLSERAPVAPAPVRLPGAGPLPSISGRHGGRGRAAWVWLACSCSWGCLGRKEGGKEKEKICPLSFQVL